MLAKPGKTADSTFIFKSITELRYGGICLRGIYKPPRTWMYQSHRCSQAKTPCNHFFDQRYPHFFCGVWWRLNPPFKSAIWCLIENQACTFFGKEVFYRRRCMVHSIFLDLRRLQDCCPSFFIGIVCLHLMGIRGQKCADSASKVFFFLYRYWSIYDRTITNRDVSLFMLHLF